MRWQVVVYFAMHPIGQHGELADEKERHRLRRNVLGIGQAEGEDVDDVAHLQAWHGQQLSLVFSFPALRGGHIVFSAHLLDRSVGFDDAHSKHVANLHLAVEGHTVTGESHVVELSVATQGGLVVDLHHAPDHDVAAEFRLAVRIEDVETILLRNHKLVVGGQDDLRLVGKPLRVLRIQELRRALRPYLATDVFGKGTVVCLVGSKGCSAHKDYGYKEGEACNDSLYHGCSGCCLRITCSLQASVQRVRASFHSGMS